ncbi:MAG: CsgG/HfaB family protein [bacterium]
MLKKDSFAEAINLLVEAEQENPNNYKIKRDLGVAYYKTEQLDKALDKLQEAKTMQAADSKTIFYLGLTYESKDMLTEAINEYKNYKNLGRSRRFRNEISKRIKQLTTARVSGEIAEALTNEANLDVAAIPENTVAVLYFKNLGTSDELDPLQKGLAQMLITDLAKANKLKIVERLKLQKLLEELEFGTTGLVDENTAPRVGKLLGAHKLINGGFTDLTDENLRIDASLAETATAKISNVEELTGKLNTIFSLEKKLAFEVIDELGVQLTKEEREAIEKIPTESLLAFIAYSKGLDFEDRGMYEQAKQEYEKAVLLDSKFDLAQESLDDVEIAQSAATEPKVEPANLESEFETTSDGMENLTKSSRLLNTSIAALTGQTPQGDNDTRKPVQEGTGTDNATPTTAIIPIRVPLPPGGN